MIDLRDKTPVKRDSPKDVKHYREYKQELKADYYSRCGYCNDADHWMGGWRFFQLDHFVPKKYLVKISVNEYTNLVYSCFFCNNSKRAKWFGTDENICTDGVTGFIHPVTANYDTHFYRNAQGSILPKTDLGKYMIKALKLDLKRHAIIWNLEKLEPIIDEMEEEYNKKVGKIPEALSNKIAQLLFQYRKYSKLLRKEADA